MRVFRYILILTVWNIVSSPLIGQDTKSIVTEFKTAIASSGIDAAVEKYRKILVDEKKSDLKDESQLEAFGRELLRTGNVYEAVKVLELTRDAFPESWRAWQALGRAYHDRGGKFNEAVGAFQKALELHPGVPSGTLALKRMQGLGQSFRAETTDTSHFKPGEPTGLKGPYLGQQPPDTLPKVFAPGIVSTQGKFEYGCTFSHDMKSFYFTRAGEGILVSRLEDTGWTAPQKTEFKGNEPHISLRGDKLYSTQQANILVAERLDEGWSDPVTWRPGVYVSTIPDGSAYFTDITNERDTGVLMKSVFMDDHFEEAVQLSGDLHSPFNDAHPCIAHDESFLVFDSTRPGGKGWSDFYVSFRDEDGSWGQAIHLDIMSTPGNDICASLSPDGKYLFFTMNNDIYWVNADILKSYKNED